MAIFMIGANDIPRIKEAGRLAIASAIPLETVRRMATKATEDAEGVVRGDRAEDMPEPQTIILGYGWRLNLSCEEQPRGLYLHASLSSPTPGKTLPRQEAMMMVLDTIGGCGKPVAGWVEEYKEDGVVIGKALNVLAPVKAQG